MKIRTTTRSLLIGMGLSVIVQSICLGAPPVATPPPAPPSSPASNPNINGPAPGNNINNGNIPNDASGQPYNVGTSNVGGFNGNPNINGPAPGNVINNTNTPNDLGQRYATENTNEGFNNRGLTNFVGNYGRTNFGGGYNQGGTNLGSYAVGNTNWSDYTNANGTVTYNTNSPHWWEKK